MFTIQIQCATIEDAEQVMATLRHEVPSVVENLADLSLRIEDEPSQMTGLMAWARAALKRVQHEYGADNMAVPLELLGRFKAGRISELHPDDYQAFIAACNEA